MCTTQQVASIRQHQIIAGWNVCYVFLYVTRIIVTLWVKIPPEATTQEENNMTIKYYEIPIILFIIIYVGIIITL